MKLVYMAKTKLNVLNAVLIQVGRIENRIEIRVEKINPHSLRISYEILYSSVMELKNFHNQNKFNVFLK